MKETIEVEHHTGDEVNLNDFKRFSFSAEGYTINVDIGRGEHDYKGVWITVEHESTDEGFAIRTHAQHGHLRLCIDDSEGMYETQYRTYNEWRALENKSQQVAAALKLLGGMMK